MRKTMKRITAFVLAMAVLMTTVNWSFVSERTEAEMLDASSTHKDNTESETGTSENTVIPAVTFPPQEEAEPLPLPSPEASTTSEWKVTSQTDDVKFTVSAEAGVVPEGTTVKVVPIRKDLADTQSQYTDVEAQLVAKAEGESYDIIGFLAYDITLIDPEGNEIEPNGDVKVTMEYIKATLPEEVASSEESNVAVTVMHFAENEVGEVKEVVDLGKMDSGLSEELKINKISSLQVDENQAIEEAAFLTDSFSWFTIVWKEVNDAPTLNVKIVINNQTVSDNNNGGLVVKYVIDGLADKDNRSATQIANHIANDKLLQGCHFLGMQIGNYNANKQHAYQDNEGNAKTTTYVSAISYNDGRWLFSPVPGIQSWPQCDFTDTNGVPTITLVYESYLEVHVIDKYGNPLKLNLEPNNLSNIIDNASRLIQFVDWDPENGIYRLKFPEAKDNGGGANTDANTIRGLIAQNASLNDYIYAGATLDTYDQTNIKWDTQQVSFNPVHDAKRTWITSNNGWEHWTPVTSEDSPYPKMYLVYTPKGETATLKVKLIDAETGNEIRTVEPTIVTTAQTSVAVSTIREAVQEYVESDYTYIGAQPNQYNDGPVGNIWIYNIAYNFASESWYYSTSQGANPTYQDWVKGKEATLCLIYDKKNNQLHEIETLKNTGITIRMLDYSTYGQDIMDGDTKYTGRLGGGNNTAAGWNGNIKPNLLKPVLGSDGYPITADHDNEGEAGLSLKNLFDPEGGYYINPMHTDRWVESYGEADGLFSKEIFDETGYYSYSSFENYAYLNTVYDDDGNIVSNTFKVYEEIGTPEDTTEYNRYYYYRGNFLPFNTIAADKIAKWSRNWYNGNGSRMTRDQNHPRYGETLYKTQGITNYWFGMYMEANFYKPEKGLVENPSTGELDNMVYKFNGDDDLWIYVDNVLLLDIGGIHDAHDGAIDFATGKITWTDCLTGQEPVGSSTTIKKRFFDAKVFPDGTEWTDWNDPRVAEFFEGDTFKDYTVHNMKMFYMERGKGASNLQMTFNLKVIPVGTVEVTKQLDGDDQERYSDVEFAVQVWAQKETAPGSGKYSNEYETIKTAQYKNQFDENGNPVPLQPNTVEVGNTTYEDVFYITANETVQFTGIAENRHYKVVELKLDEDKYDTAKFQVAAGTVPAQPDTNGNYVAGPFLSKEQVQLIIINTCKTDDFELSKKMATDQKSNDEFTFKVWVEDLNGTLVPYSGKYMIGTEEKSTADGKIQIKADQKALFKGFLIGTRFYVEEVDLNTAYEVPAKSPSTVSGTLPLKVNASDTTVTKWVTPDGAVAADNNSNVTVTITNQYKPSVKVNKVWHEETSITHNGDIYVGLYEKTGDIATPIAGKYLALNQNNGWTAIWNYVDSGKTYVVKELREVKNDETAEFTIDSKGYIGMAGGENIVVDSVKYRVSDTTSISGQDNTTGAKLDTYTVTNTIVWNIFKTGLGTNNQDNRDPLKDAYFVLTNTTDDTTKYVGVSNADGVVKWSEDGTEVTVIPDGTYTLQEQKAPTGYMLNTEKWTIEVKNGVPTVTSDANGSVVGSRVDDNGEKIEELWFEFHNSPMYDLPSSGAGNGTFGIFGYIAGGIIIMLAAVILVFKSSGKRSILEK